MATAEFAVALPAVLVVLVVCITAVLTGIDQVRCVDAARLAARSVARGDAPADARALAGQAAPPGAAIAVSPSSGFVTVTVSVPRRAPLLGISWVVRSTAVAPLETGSP